MKYVLLTLAAALLFSSAALPTQASIAPPVDTVRIITDDGNLRCSAVVIAPETAVTANHCVFADMKVDYLRVTRVVSSDGDKDVAVLRVPGLTCPCASLGVMPAKGDQVIAVGYPGDREPEREISAVSRVEYIGKLGEFMPDTIPPDDPWFDAIYIITDASVIRPGYSGGALFAMQDGDWRVVGINSLNLAKPETLCHPFFGCVEYHNSGFVPVDVVKEFL